MNERLKGMLGMAIKAGRAVSGSFAVEGAIKRGRARLVVVDGRASAGTVKNWQSVCASRSVPCVVLNDAGMLEALSGRENRTVLAVTDDGFAKVIVEICKEE